MIRTAASRALPPPDDTAGDENSPALRLIALLEHVSRAGKALTLADIIGEVHLPKPTVYRMLQQLEHAGLLVKETRRQALRTGRAPVQARRRRAAQRAGARGAACDPAATGR